MTASLSASSRRPTWRRRRKRRTSATSSRRSRSHSGRLWRNGSGDAAVSPLVSRLRRADCSTPGITRRRRGRGFEYLDVAGSRVEDPETLERIRSLAIPPAWAEVWICPDPNGHLQAVGTDAAGRRQYLYHERWRTRRDQEKFDHALEFARTLPRVRAESAKHLALEGLPAERVLACATRLLDRGF